MSRRAKIITIIAVLLILILSSVLFRRGDFKIGEKLPNFTLKTIKGEEMSLYNVNKKVVIVHFWATYCDVCREEADNIENFYRMYKDKGVEILAVNIEPGNSDGVKNFIESFNWSFPVLLDPDAQVAQKYRVTGVPETLVLDGNFSLRMKRFLGPVNWMSPHFRSEINRLIGEKF